MSEFFRDYPDVQWTLVGFFIFIGFFTIFVISTYLPAQKKIHSHLRGLPLENPENGDRS